MEQNNQRPFSTTWEFYRRVIRRRRWWLFLPVFVCWAIVWGVSWFVPSTYRSEALILVEQQKIPEHFVVSNVASDLQIRLQSMTQQILSRTRLLKIIDEMHLYPKERSRLSPDELVDLMRKDVTINLLQSQTSGRPNELTAFRISYSGTDPTVAQRVTSTLTSFFIDEDLRERGRDAEGTTNFLDNQLQAARKQLEEQEQQVRQFNSQYQGRLPQQFQGNLQILAGLQSRLQGLNERLGRAEQQKVYLNSLISEYRALSTQIREGSADTGKDMSPPALDTELSRLKRQMSGLQAKYTDKHPDVVYLKDEIAKTELLKKQIDEDLAQAKDEDKDASSGNVGLRPDDTKSVMELESQLKANEVEIQRSTHEMQSLEQAADEYKARINETPVRGQQLADLTRDYNQSHANYESLLEKKNQSELATNLEKRQQGEQFRILDAPSLPEKPYSPDRLQLSLYSLAVGLVLGGVITAVLEGLDDRVFQETDLADIATLPLLTIIPPILTLAEQRRRSWHAWLELVGATSLAIIILGANAYTYYLTYYRV
jgi:protein tyrosine kinase modulator